MRGERAKTSTLYGQSVWCTRGPLQVLLLVGNRLYTASEMNDFVVVLVVSFYSSLKTFPAGFL